MNIYLIRHTAIVIDPELCYGQTDLPLADSFEQECTALQAKIPPQFDMVYSSPLSRCRQLAERLRAKERRQDPRLLELNFGKWEMKPWRELEPLTPFVWMDNHLDFHPPAGESFHDLEKRVEDFWREMTHLPHPTQTVGVVSHAGVLRTLIAFVIGLPLAEVFKLSFSYGSVSLIRREGERTTLQFFNK